MNVADVIRRVQRIFGDNTEAQIYVADVLDWINDAQLEIVRQTQCLQRSANVLLISGSEAGPYPLPSDFQFGVRLTYQDVALKLITLEQLEEFSNVVDKLTPSIDIPDFYYIWGHDFYLYPPPVYSASPMVLYYIYTPQQVTSSGDSLSIPSSYHEDVVRYCLSRAHELNENYAASDRVSADFQNRMSVSKDQAQNPHDSYPVVRDYAGDYSW